MSDETESDWTLYKRIHEVIEGTDFDLRPDLTNEDITQMLVDTVHDYIGDTIGLTSAWEHAPLIPVRCAHARLIGMEPWGHPWGPPREFSGLLREVEAALSLTNAGDPRDDVVRAHLGEALAWVKAACDV